MFQNTETWPLRYPGAAWVRLFLFSFIGIAPPALTTVTLLGMDVVEALDIDSKYGPLALVGFVVVLLTAIVLPLVCLKMREPGPARLTLDAWGVTEWDGERARTAISWARARVFVLETRVRQRYGGVYRGGMTFSVGSDAGWAVNAWWGHHTELAWRRRVLSAERFGPEAVAARVPAQVRRAEGTMLDPRDGRRGLRLLSRVIGLAFLAAIGAGFSQMNDLGPGHREPVGLAFLVAGLLAIARASRPLVENARLSREARPCAAAVPITFTPGQDGGLLRGMNATQQPVTLDVSAVTHPDELLFRRGGVIHCALDVASLPSGGAYRGDVPLRASAAETDRDRAERARIRRANRIELTMRFALAALLLVSGAVLIAGLQAH